MRAIAPRYLFTNPLETPMTVQKTLFALALAVGFTAPALADDDYRYYEQNRSQFISHDRAAEIASEAVGGGRVTDVEFDRDYHGDHFEVEVIGNDGREHDVTVDAKSGKVLSKRVDD